jgi:hypothetical protein
MVAEIWESRSGDWFGQLVDETTGWSRSIVFEARSRSCVIATILSRQLRRTVTFRDTIRPTRY